MMDIKIDNEIIVSFSDTEIQIAQHRIPDFSTWIKEGVVNIMNNKVNMSMDQLDADYAEILAERYTSIPTDREERAALIFSQSDYEPGY